VNWSFDSSGSATIGFLYFYFVRRSLFFYSYPARIFSGLPGLQTLAWCFKAEGRNVRRQFLHWIKASLSNLWKASSLYCIMIEAACLDPFAFLTDSIYYTPRVNELKRIAYLPKIGRSLWTRPPFFLRQLLLLYFPFFLTSLNMDL